MGRGLVQKWEGGGGGERERNGAYEFCRKKNRENPVHGRVIGSV